MLSKATNIVVAVLFVLLVAALGFEALTASQQIPSEPQTQKFRVIKDNPEKAEDSALNEAHIDQQTAERKAKQREARHVLKEFFVGFVEIKLTDLLIAIFTIVLAVKTAGLFRETARLSDAAEAQRVDSLRAIEAAEKSAKAAQLNAEALMVAEAAQMYLVIERSNVEQIYKLGGMYNKSPTMHPSPSDAPWVEYRLRNYGKSPAVVQSVFHGIMLSDPDAHSEREYEMGQDGMEIVGVGEQGQVITSKYDRAFTFGDVRSIVADDKSLWFFGRAVFIDHFGRKQTLEWLHVAQKCRWELVSHRTTRVDEDSES